MPGWLSRLPERTRGSGELAAWVDAKRPAYLVLDQRRAPEACAALVGQPGWRDYLTLFAGTPLAPLLEAGPWLVELEVGSEAWQALGALCTGQRLGWAFQPAHATPLNDLADHLRRFFVLGDSHGGQSLVNIQDAAAWTALLAAGSDTAYAQLIGPLGQVVTPTPQQHWQAWHTATEKAPSHEPSPLTREAEAALRLAPGAWWLSRAAETPLHELPEAWLARLGRLNRAGIIRAEHLRRLLGLICQQDGAFSAVVEQAIGTSLPPRKKVHALESLI